MRTIEESELVLDNGKVYHLGLFPQNIASKIILVGDPGRVEKVSSYFDTILFSANHREFYTVTGIYKSKKITVLSTGIGTDNIDIVMNELDALVNIDLSERKINSTFNKLEIVRIGTSGILHPEIPILTYLLSSYSLGMDNIAHFYENNFSNEEISLLNEIRNQISFPKNVIPYISKSSEVLLKKLSSKNTFDGITVTASGFFGPQGRQLRIPLTSNSLNDAFSQFKHEHLSINNFEMESSALSFLAKAMGHEATTICLGIGNRHLKQFATNYDKEMGELITYVLDRI